MVLCCPTSSATQSWSTSAIRVSLMFCLFITSFTHLFRKFPNLLDNNPSSCIFYKDWFGFHSPDAAWVKLKKNNDIDKYQYFNSHSIFCWLSVDFLTPTALLTSLRLDKKWHLLITWQPRLFAIEHIRGPQYCSTQLKSVSLWDSLVTVAVVVVGASVVVVVVASGIFLGGGL